MAAVTYTTNELMAVTAARALRDGQNVVVGLGLPQVAALLAKRTHAPNLNIIYEIGVANAEAVDPGVGIADPRLWHRSEYFTSSIGALGSILQKGLVDVGFLGALQIDCFGNLNSTQVKLADGSIRHFTGSGGAADIATFARNIFVIMKHEKRKITASLDYLTSVGLLAGGDSRSKAGLPMCLEVKIITNLCVFGIKRGQNVLEVQSLHPGVAQEDVLANTGFAVTFAADLQTTGIPTEVETTLLRTRIDPRGLFIK
ncbi:MAG: hypothetical protein GX200_10070 [Firmicutes bacterium]|nr:hypothetical protein [Bacillota bacterium]